jgi:HK97 gp10 family phage protein
MIRGKELVIKDLDKLSQIDLHMATDKAIQLVRSTAVANVPVDTGELRDSIFSETEGTEYGARGTCWTNKEYATYVEFGTGPVGQENHDGIAPDVPVAYTQSPWVYQDADGNYHYTAGQPARPYMYPALANNEDEIVAIYEKKIREATE